MIGYVILEFGFVLFPKFQVGYWCNFIILSFHIGLGKKAGLEKYSYLHD